MHAFAPTRPGWDGTARPESIASVTDLAHAYLARLVDHGESDVVLVGSSIGGWIALEMAVHAAAVKNFHGLLGAIVVIDGVGAVVEGQPVADFFALVNNAGSSYTDPLMVQPIEDFRMQMEVNVVDLFAVTKSFFPLLGGDPALSGAKGRIVNLGSVGGRIAFPLLGAYVTAKHAVEGLSGALRRELQLVGIDVIVVAPGPVQTSIWDKAEAETYPEVTGTIWDTPFRKYVSWMIDSGRKGLPAERVGKVITHALTARKPKTRYAPVQGKLFNEIAPSLLPARTVDRVLGRQFGLLP